MELRQLTYFVAIARAGSFSKAASHLRVAQPALSRQMGLLERELGVLLFTRNGRGAVPTAAGELLLAKASEILHIAEDTKWQISSFSATPSGVLRIGVPLSISRILTADRSTAYASRSPVCHCRSARRGRPTFTTTCSSASLTSACSTPASSLPTCAIAASVVSSCT